MLRVWAAEMEGQVGVCGHWADLGVPRLSHCRWLAAVAALRLRYFLSHDARGVPPPLPWFAPRPPAELAALPSISRCIHIGPIISASALAGSFLTVGGGDGAFTPSTRDTRDS